MQWTSEVVWYLRPIRGAPTAHGSLERRKPGPLLAARHRGSRFQSSETDSIHLMYINQAELWRLGPIRTPNERAGLLQLHLMDKLLQNKTHYCWMIVISICSHGKVLFALLPSINVVVLTHLRY